ncbi:unnamed protein product [Urochloa humidicola]
MSPRKQCGAPTAAPALPSDLVLEIVARSDAETLVRCAACCKPLRRDILSRAFIRRVCHGPGGAVVPPRLLGFLQSLHSPVLSRDSLPPASFSLAHPATPAAARLSEKHLTPSLSGGLIDRYDPVESRGGLVVLRRRRHATAAVPGEESGICVYDLMTGSRAFFEDTPEMAYFSSYSSCLSYVVLTASDGIGAGRSAFLLLAADFTALLSPGSPVVKFRTVSSDAGEWSPVTSAPTHRRTHGSTLHHYCSAVVLGGAVVHWAMRGAGGGDEQNHILTYNVRTATAGSIKLPTNLPASYSDMNRYDANLRLASSPDGKQLTMFVREELRIFIWRLLSAGGVWARHAVIDVETELSRSSLTPLPPRSRWQDGMIQLLSSWERSGVVLFYLGGDGEEGGLVALDVETEEMHRVDGHRHMPFIPFDVDMESRLSSMKTFW